MARQRISDKNDNLDKESYALEYNEIMKKTRDEGHLYTDNILQFGIVGGLALEIGSGPGFLGLEWLKKTKNTQLKGLDINNHFIKIAPENAKEYGFADNRVEYVQGNAGSIDFKDNTFDAVFSNATLHELDDPIAAFNEIYRILKPGGKFFISDLRRDMNFIAKMLMKKQATSKEMLSGLVSSLNAAYTQRELEGLLKKTKITNYEIVASPFSLIVQGVKPEIVELDEDINVIGLTVSTSSKNLPMEIQKINQTYEMESISSKIPNKKKPSKYFGIHVRTDQKDTFTYILGEDVSSVSDVPSDLTSYKIPAGKYAVFTVLAEAPNNLGIAIATMKKHLYNSSIKSGSHKNIGLSEFELYDERSQRSENLEMDIYVPL